MNILLISKQRLKFFSSHRGAEKIENVKKMFSSKQCLNIPVVCFFYPSLCLPAYKSIKQCRSPHIVRDTHYCVQEYVFFIPSPSFQQCNGWYAYTYRIKKVQMSKILPTKFVFVPTAQTRATRVPKVLFYDAHLNLYIKEGVMYR